MRLLKLKNFILIILILISGTMLLLVSTTVIFISQKHNSQKDIQFVLNEAISTDVTNRMAKTYGDLRFGYDANSISAITIQKKDTASVPRDISKFPVDQRVQKAIQSYLLPKDPIKVKSLDSLFQVLLMQHNIVSQTAIRYTNNLAKTISDSKPNSNLYSSKYALEEIILGMQDEITIQGYAKVSSIHIFQRGKKIFLISTALILLLTGLLVIAAYHQRRKFTIPTTGLYKIARQLQFDMDKPTLFYKDNAVGMAPQSARLLKLFLEAPEFYLEYDNLEILLWGNINLLKNRREQAVNRLRESLGKIPSLHLINERGVGYRLYIGSKPEPDKTESFVNDSVEIVQKSTVDFSK